MNVRPAFRVWTTLSAAVLLTAPACIKKPQQAKPLVTSGRVAPPGEFPSVIMIKAGQFTASGFLASVDAAKDGRKDPGRIIVTNKHAVWDPESKRDFIEAGGRAQIVWYDANKKRMRHDDVLVAHVSKAAGYDQKTDLAVVVLAEPLPGTTTSPLAFRAPQLQERIRLAGFGCDKAANRSKAINSAIDKSQEEAAKQGAGSTPQDRGVKSGSRRVTRDPGTWIHLINALRSDYIALRADLSATFLGTVRTGEVFVESIDAQRVAARGALPDDGAPPVSGCTGDSGSPWFADDGSVVAVHVAGKKADENLSRGVRIDTDAFHFDVKNWLSSAVREAEKFSPDSTRGRNVEARCELLQDGGNQPTSKSPTVTIDRISMETIGGMVLQQQESGSGEVQLEDYPIGARLVRVGGQKVEIELNQTFIADNNKAIYNGVDSKFNYTLTLERTSPLLELLVTSVEGELWRHYIGSLSQHCQETLLSGPSSPADPVKPPSAAPR